MKRCGNCNSKYDASKSGNSFNNWCSTDCGNKLVAKKNAQNNAKMSYAILKPEKINQSKGALKRNNGFKTRKPLQNKSSLNSNTSIKTFSTLKGAAIGTRQYKIEKKERELKRRVKQEESNTPLFVPEYDVDSLKLKTKTLCHLFVRMRDAGEVCICCGLQLGPDFHAGHFMESGNNSELRYDLNNINGQRAICNIAEGGDSGEYEQRLTIKIGGDNVDDLIFKSKQNIIVKRTVEDYLRLIAEFECLIVELKLKQ